MGIYKVFLDLFVSASEIIYCKGIFLKESQQEVLAMEIRDFLVKRKGA